MIHLTVFLLIFGSIFLIVNYIYASIYSRTDISEINIKNSLNSRYIYNKFGTKLYADFEINEKTRKIAVFYLGYGCNHKTIASLKDLYLKQLELDTAIQQNHNCSYESTRYKRLSFHSSQRYLISIKGRRPTPSARRFELVPVRL